MPSVRLPNVLRPHAGGAAVVQAEGETVGAVLASLEAAHPGLAGQLRNEDGSAHRFVNVYVNDEDIRYLDKLDTKAAEGDTVSLLPSVAGCSGARH